MNTRFNFESTQVRSDDVNETFINYTHQFHYFTYYSLFSLTILCKFEYMTLIRCKVSIMIIDFVRYICIC